MCFFIVLAKYFSKHFKLREARISRKKNMYIKLLKVDCLFGIVVFSFRNSFYTNVLIRSLSGKVIFSFRN